MNKTVTSLLFLLMFVPQLLLAQGGYMNQIKVEDVHVARNGEYVTLNMNICLDDLKMRSNDVLLLSPAL
ncbi:DUF3868 domain-containing protein, partial [Porphyromonas levii]